MRKREEVGRAVERVLRKTQTENTSCPPLSFLDRLRKTLDPKSVPSYRGEKKISLIGKKLYILSIWLK
jgi:hypothetical protein